MPRRKSKIAKQIFKKFLIGGAIVIAAQSPYFWLQFWKNIFAGEPLFGERKKIRDTFYYFKKRGWIEIEKRGKQIYIHLTKEGEWEAGKYQIEGLYIKSQKKWDRKWRIIIFDIPENHRIKREALRGKLKELNFYPLQKSVWLYPYPCEKEINLLREFFNLDEKNVRIIEATRIGDDEFFKKLFKI